MKHGSKKNKHPCKQVQEKLGKKRINNDVLL
jgi:hypothetical protein